MSSYAGSNFIFDGTPSQLYGLQLMTRGNDTDFNGGSTMELKSDRAARSLKTYYYAAEPSEPLSFEIEIFSRTEIPALKADAIKSWLFGQLKPKKLYILNGDYSDCYCYCFLNNPQDIKINGRNGFKCTVQCDAGGFWENAKTVSYSNVGASDGVIYFNNTSGSNDYMYPTVKFTLGSSATSFSIKNESDNDRIFSFSGLANSETITINGDTLQITSSSGSNRLDKFNKHPLRFVRGSNKLVCNGAITLLEFTYQNFRRMGG